MAGIKAAFAFPVLVGTEVAVVLEFFTTHEKHKDRQLLDAVPHIGTQLGRVIEINPAEKRMHRREKGPKQAAVPKLNFSRR